MEPKNNTDTALREALRLIQQDTDRHTLSEAFYEQVEHRYASLNPTRPHSTERLPRQERHTGAWWRKVAAVFLGLLLVSGLALAAIHLVRPSQSSPQSCLVDGDSIAANGTGDSREQAVRFENARLDSVLAVVAAHYGCAVSFVDEPPRRLRLSTTWQPTRPLSDFTSLMNELDGLHLTVSKDTIVVNEKTLPHPLPTREGRE